MSYLEFMYLVKYSSGVITDSGGLSEETTFLRVPCITIRTTTERPETVNIGTNVLVGKNHTVLSDFQKKMVAHKWKNSGMPDLWDGLASQRIVSHLANQFIPTKITERCQKTEMAPLNQASAFVQEDSLHEKNNLLRTK